MKTLRIDRSQLNDGGWQETFGLTPLPDIVDEFDARPDDTHELSFLDGASGLSSWAYHPGIIIIPEDWKVTDGKWLPIEDVIFVDVRKSGATMVTASGLKIRATMKSYIIS